MNKETLETLALEKAQGIKTKKNLNGNLLRRQQ